MKFSKLFLILLFFFSFFLISSIEADDDSVTATIVCSTGPDATYTRFCDENASCSLPSGIYEVAFGCQTSFKYADDKSGTIACNAGSFGGDPIGGVAKACFYKKATEPTVTTLTATRSCNTFSSGGDVTADNGSAVSQKGVVWGTSTNPETSLSTKTNNGAGTGPFTSSITGLTQNTTYYYRAYGINNVGSGYGNESSFTTFTYPSVTTNAVETTSITSTSATLNGNITNTGGALSNDIRGFVYGKTSITTTPGSDIVPSDSGYTNHSTTTGTFGTGLFTAGVTGLDPNTTYNYRAFSHNCLGYTYGGEVSFTTSVAKTNPTCLVNNPSISYTGSPVEAIISTSTSSRVNNVKYNGSSTIPTAVESYTITADLVPDDQTNYNNVNGVTCSGGFAITKANQTIELADQTIFNGSSFSNPLSVTGGLGTGQVTYEVTTAGAGCYLPSTAILDYTTTGSCVVTATKAGDTNYLADTDTGTFKVNPTLPDLMGQPVNENQATVNIEKSFTASIINIGDSSTSTDFPYFFQVAPQADGNGTPENKTSSTMTALAGRGNSSTATVSHKFTSAGTYSIRVCADFTSPGAGAVIAESNEGNNCGFPWMNVTVSEGAPSTPTNLQVTPSTCSNAWLNLSWSESAGATSYKVYRDGNATPITLESYSCSSGSCSGSDNNEGSGLELGSTHSYTIKASNTGGDSAATSPAVSAIVASACNLPTVTTASATAITQTIATSGGNVTSDGGSSVNARGVVWNTSPNPTTSNTKTTNGTGTGTFTSSITGLTQNTKYYYRAYATNGVGTAYGTEYSMTTDAGDSCGSGSGTTPQLTEPTGASACAVGTLNSNSPADITTLGLQAWNWSCGIVNTCSAPKYGCRTTYDSNYDLPQYGPNNPDNNYGCAGTCENGSTNYAGGCPIYNITFNANGGTGTMSTQSIPQGQTENLNENTFERVGHNFSGWNTMANGTGNNYSDQQSYTMGGADVTLFAQWTIGDSCGPGSGITPQFIEPTGSDACTTGTLNSSVPSDTTTLGAQAWNWSCGIINTCSAPKYGCRTTYDSNYDLPQYGPNNPDNNYGCALTCENGSTNYAGGCPVYNITFNSNGGTGTMSAQTIPQGVTANLTANTFTRTGYTFAGWATSAGGSVSYADQAPYTMGGADATLYAKWTAIPYNLTLTKNVAVGGTVSFSPTGTSCDTNCTSIINTYGYNTDVTLTATRSGSYTFTGWEGACSGTSSTCTVDMTEARSVKANFSTGNITLASSTCTIPYGGTTCNAIVSWETANLIQNTPVAVTRNNPSVEISTNASGTNVINAVNSGTSTYYLYHNGIILDQESIVASNTYKVSFNANDGNGTMSAQEIVSGQTKNLNANTFTRTGYTFGGWATSAGGSVIYADQASYTMGGADVTLYAKWTPIPYNLTITKNPEEGGTVISNPVGISCGATCSQLFGYNTTVVLTATPTGGSSFIGWGSGCDSVSGNTCTLLITSNRSVAVNFMSGKLTPRSPSCSILAGGSSCDILMDWEIKNPVGLTTEITAVGMENIEVSNSTYPLIQYGTRTLSIPYGWREFYLYNNAVELASSNINALCTTIPAPGTSWEKGVCEPNRVPTVIDPTVSNVVTIKGRVNALLGANITSAGVPSSILERGFCISTYNSFPVMETSCTPPEGGTTIGSYTQLRKNILPGLTPKTYYFRGYARNATGTGYSESGTFITEPVVLPTVITNPVTNISTTYAQGGGNVTNDGNGLITSSGLIRSTSPNPTISSYSGRTYDGWADPGDWRSWMWGLSPGTVYYVKAYAVNEAGVSYGQELTFKTLRVPTVIDPTVTSIEPTQAILGANVTDLGYPAEISERGTCLGLSSTTVYSCSPEGGTEAGIFTLLRKGLNPATTYFYRGYATNVAGRGYSAIASFTTPYANLTALTPEQDTATINENKNFSSIVYNLGNYSTGAGFYNMFHICQDSAEATQHCSTTYIMKQTELSSILEPNSAVSIVTNHTFPSIGVYAIRACADLDSSWNDLIEESNEDDNCSRWNDIVVNPVIGSPDLTASVVSPTAAAEGVPKTFSSTILNEGSVATQSGFRNFFQICPESDVSLFPLPEDCLNPIDKTSTIMSALPVLGSAITTTNHTFLADGIYYIRACADKTDRNTNEDTDNINETNESNNCSRWIDVTVGNGPDLIASAPMPETASVGDNIFTSTVKNQGNINIGSSFNNFFQTTEDNPEVTLEGDMVISDVSGSSISILNAGLSKTTTATINYTTPGKYYVRACADKTDRNTTEDTDSIDEINENNNCSEWTEVLADLLPEDGDCNLDFDTSGYDPISFDLENYEDSELCLVGSPENAEPERTYLAWDCVGPNDGSIAHCNKLIATPGVCVLSELGCLDGEPQDFIEYPEVRYTWDCLGINGGKKYEPYCEQEILEITVELTATPNPVVNGKTTILEWKSNGAYCKNANFDVSSFMDPISGIILKDGKVPVTPTAPNQEYEITCYGNIVSKELPDGTGGKTASVIVNVVDPIFIEL